MSFLSTIEQIPDRLLPGLDAKSYPLYVCWREVCHIFGSLILLGISHLLFTYSLYNIPVVVFLILLAWMTYQEFYLHPKLYGQKLWKGILDWLSWVVPFTLYFIFI